VEKIAFVLPLNRFEENDKLATRAALRHALGVNDAGIDAMIRDANAHGQFLINFRCDSSQFTKFLIMRHELGGKNWFADLKARVLDNEAPMKNKRIVDFTMSVKPDSTYPFRIRDDFPQHFVDQTNERRKERSFGARYSMGAGYGGSPVWGGDIYERVAKGIWPGSGTPHVKEDRDYTLTVEAMDADLVIALHDGAVLRSKHDMNVRVEEGGILLVKFKEPPAKTDREIGVAAHALVDALMADVKAENEKLRHMMRRMANTLEQAARHLLKSRPTLANHALNLVRSAKGMFS
jgi:hypothetical protein